MNVIGDDCDESMRESESDGTSDNTHSNASVVRAMLVLKRLVTWAATRIGRSIQNHEYESRREEKRASKVRTQCSHVDWEGLAGDDIRESPEGRRMHS